MSSQQVSIPKLFTLCYTMPIYTMDVAHVISMSRPIYIMDVAHVISMSTHFRSHALHCKLWFMLTLPLSVTSQQPQIGFEAE